MKLGVMVFGFLLASASLGEEKQHSGLKDDAAGLGIFSFRYCRLIG
jgi:hypothetical protein